MKNWISCDIGGVVVTMFLQYTLREKEGRIIRHKKAWSKNNSTQWKKKQQFPLLPERLKQHTMEKETTISSSSRTITTAHNGKRNNNFLFFPNDHNSTQWKKKQQFPVFPERLQQHTMRVPSLLNSFHPSPSYDVPLLRVINNHAGGRIPTLILPWSSS